MADLTKAQISDQIQSTAIKTWFDTAGDFPADTELADVFAALHEAAYMAQVAYNATNPAQLVTAYNAPAIANATFDATLGRKVYNVNYGFTTVQGTAFDAINITAPVA